MALGYGLKRELPHIDRIARNRPEPPREPPRFVSMESCGSMGASEEQLDRFAEDFAACVCDSQGNIYGPLETRWRKAYCTIRDEVYRRLPSPLDEMFRYRR